jgi:hypothetical protein
VAAVLAARVAAVVPFFAMRGRIGGRLGVCNRADRGVEEANLLLAIQLLTQMLWANGENGG